MNSGAARWPRQSLPCSFILLSFSSVEAQLYAVTGGPVIAPDEADRLFQPFQRLVTARTSNGSGHGLGLSIVRAIATAHGADVSARARPEGGLHIEVSFPAG